MNENTAFDAKQFKIAMQHAWDSAALGWNQQTPQIHAWLADATRLLLDHVNLKPGSRVLDVAAGSGDQTLEIARRIGPDGHVLATDISPGILQFAIENARRASLNNIDVKAADAENLGLGAATFDAAISRLGLMFCPDPLKALQEMHHALRESGRAGTLVFSEPQKNPCIGILVATAFKHAGLPPRDPYQPGSLLSLGKPGLINELFMKAGFTDVATTAVPAVFRLATAKDYLHFIRTSASPIMQILSKLNAAEQDAAWAETEEKLRVFQTSSGWEGPNELLLTTGTRSA
jgi:ubiquinone/menaquinone biosynthesis C-methylase UbiE